MSDSKKIARLIDAQRLEDTWNQNVTMIENVEAQPTVEAISVSYIEQYAENALEAGDVLTHDMLVYIIDNWRKYKDYGT